MGFSQGGIVDAVARARTRAAIITLAMLAVGIGGAVGLAAALARPIVRLMQGTRAVADGDFSVALAVTTRDELGALTAAFNDMTRNLREKEMIKHAFSRYVAREVVDEILKDPAQIALTGDRREVTVLFCDIRGFTSTAETLAPEEVVELLNGFYELMIDDHVQARRHPRQVPGRWRDGGLRCPALSTGSRADGGPHRPRHAGRHP